MLVSRETATHYHWAEVCDGWPLLQNEALSVISERMPPNTQEVRHYHNYAQQFFYVLRGTLVMELDGTTYTLTSDQGIAVAAGMPHHVVNQSTSDVDFLVISHPATAIDRIIAPPSKE